MYIFGHTAFAYCLIRPFLGSDKNYSSAKIILFIFVFANLIDVIHFWIFRFLGHNLIGTLLLIGIALGFFNKTKIIETKHFPILISATLTHVITDYWFSKYHFLFPFTKAGHVVFGFNSYEALVAESFFTALFLIMFFTYQDHKKLMKFIRREKKNFSMYFKFKRLLEPRFYLFYLFMWFYLFCIGQFVIFLSLNKTAILFLTWYVWLALIMFISFLILISYLTFKNPEARN